jgi:hypothetical protein
MRRLWMFCFIAIVLAGATFIAFAGNPHCPPDVPTQVCTVCANPGQGGGEDLVCICRVMDNLGQGSQGACIQLLRDGPI